MENENPILGPLYRGLDRKTMRRSSSWLSAAWRVSEFNQAGVSERGGISFSYFGQQLKLMPVDLSKYAAIKRGSVAYSAALILEGRKKNNRQYWKPGDFLIRILLQVRGRGWVVNLPGKHRGFFSWR